MGATVENARFAARVTIEQKKLFQTAMQFGGYKSVSDFIISVAEQKAKQIVQRHREDELSERDAKIFFDVITGSPVINDKLQKAAKEHNNFTLDGENIIVT